MFEQEGRGGLVSPSLLLPMLATAPQPTMPSNLFINYLSRIHREEDFSFVLRGFTRLLNNPLQQTYLPHSTKKVNFHQELLVFFWKFCDYNKVGGVMLRQLWRQE